MSWKGSSSIFEKMAHFCSLTNFYCFNIQRGFSPFLEGLWPCKLHRMIACPKETELIDTYLEHQETMQVQAKTVSALKEKHMAPSKRKQMFDLMKEKGFYKKFPSKHLKKFETWLQSPSGGQLKCPGQIVSEISRFVFLSNMLIVAKYPPPPPPLCYIAILHAKTHIYSFRFLPDSYTFAIRQK